MTFDFLFWAVVFFAFASSAYAAYRRVHRRVTTPDASVLLAYYTDGADMMPLWQGAIGGMNATAIAAMAMDTQKNPKPSAAMLIRVELPFRTRIHLLGVPKTKETVQLDPGASGSIMEKVGLEGDFDEYFSLYCERGMQEETRYVLDPKAMVFTVNFCRSHNWEIIRDELYFLQAGGEVPDDPTQMWDDIAPFVKEIRPALETPDSPGQEQQRAPYGQDRRNLKCPLCGGLMANAGDYYICPVQEGILVYGSMLAQLRNGEKTITLAPKVAASKREADLACPSCGNKMTRVPYAGNVMIDSCTNCPYRWLDAGEWTQAV